MYIKRKVRKTLKILLVIFLIAAVSGAIFSKYSGISGEVVNEETQDIQGGIESIKNNAKEYSKFKVNIGSNKLDEYKQMKLKVIPGKVILSDDCSTFSVATTLDKTEKLIKSVDGTYEARPDEQDIIEELLDIFGINVDYIAIDDIKEDIFYSHMVFYNNNTILNMDVKPSDGLAIASRFKKPVYVSKKLLDEFAESKC